MATPDIFLSYNREDAARAKQFADALAQEGFNVWWDAALRSGQTYDEVTEEALHSAKAVIVLWSPRSVASRWVRAEATVADQNKTLLPVMIEPCRRPVMFELTQTAELGHWRGDRSDPAWRMFLDDVRELVGETSTSAPQLQVESRPAAQDVETNRTPPPVKRNLIVAALVLALTLAGSAVLWWKPESAKTFAGSEASVEVTVMPFTSTGSEADVAALTAGITDELIDRLRRVSNLTVVAGASAAQDTSQNRIDGSVFLDGRKLRVSARLSNPDGKIIWSDTFDRELTDLFEVQEDIATSVANALSVSLDVGLDSTANGGTKNPEAYEYYIKSKGTPCDARGCEAQIALLQRAVALDPNYAKALAGLATIYTISTYNAASREEADALLAKQEEFADRALAVNPDLWTGQAALAWFNLAKRDFVAADERQQRMAQLDPGNDPELLLNRAAILPQFGRLKEAWQVQDAVELIDPSLINQYSVITRLIGRGKFAEAAERFARLEAQDPGFAATVGTLFAPDPTAIYWANLLAEHPEDARAFARKYKLGPAYENPGVFRFDPEFLPDMPPAELKRWADRKFGFAGRIELASLAMLPAHYGHFDTALEYLELAYQRPGNSAYHLLWSPAFAELRKTKGFAKLVTDLGLVEAWRKSGDWGDFCKPLSDSEISCH